MPTKEAPQTRPAPTRPRSGGRATPPKWKPSLPTVQEESETGESDVEGSDLGGSRSPVQNHPHVQGSDGQAPELQWPRPDVPGRTGWVPVLPSLKGQPGPPPKAMLAPQREPQTPELPPESANPKRLISVEEFKELTYQNFFTQKSTAQKRIISLLTDYHKLGQKPLDEGATKKQRKAAEKELLSARNSANIPETKLDQAAALLVDMKAAAQAWLRKHTVEDDGMLTTRGPKPAKGSEAAKRAGTDAKAIKPGSFDEQHSRGIVIDGQLVEGTALSDPNSVLRINPARQKRLMGMARFQLAVEAEQRYIAGRRDLLDQSVIQDPVVRDEAAAKALEDHYGDFNSLFSKLGVALDVLVPRAGDSASFELNFSVPIPDTPLMFTGKIAMSASRATDRAVSADVEIMPGIAAGVGVAKFNAAIGMYTSVSAGSGPDIMTLVSYALYRKLRQSNAVPAEVTSSLWGGSSGRFGELKADRWSRGVEKKMWGDDAEHGDSTFLEWGTKGEVSAEAEVSAFGVGAELGMSMSAMSGSRYDKTSLTNRKGGAGEKNMRSDGLFTKYIASRFGRGAEKDVSRKSYTMSSNVSMTVGVFSGELGSTYVLRQQGYHKDQRKGLNNWVFEEIGFSGKLAADIPGGHLAVGGALLSRDIIAAIRDNSTKLVKESDTETPKEIGKVIGVGDTAAVLSGLTNGSEVALDFGSLASMTTSVSAGIEVEFSGSVTKAGTAQREAEFTIEVRMVSGVDINALGYLGIKAQKGSRLIGAKWSTETDKWEPI